MDYLTNEEVRSSVRHAIGSYEDLITTVRKRNLRWYGHIKKIIRACKDDPTGHCTRRETEKTDRKLDGRQHGGMGRFIVG